MNKVFYMHIRGKDDNGFAKNMRGVTVAYQKYDDVIVFGWAVQNPNDQYNKKEGIRIAEDRLFDYHAITIQSDYYHNFPVAYQFFNAVALAREHSKSEESHFNNEEQRFFDLTFKALMDVACTNNWFHDLDEKTNSPSIHPHIMVNLVHRFTKKSGVTRMDKDICQTLSRFPKLMSLIVR